MTVGGVGRVVVGSRAPCVQRCFFIACIMIRTSAGEDTLRRHHIDTETM